MLKIKKSLKKMRKIALDWVPGYTVTYNIDKTKAVLFFTA